MAKYVISTDAGADLPLDYVQKRDVKVISMKYTLDGKEYLFGNGEEGPSMTEIYERLRKGSKASSVLVNTEEHKEHFRKFLSQGLDIIHVPLSRGLSGTYNCAVEATKELKEEFPDRKIAIIDFRGASLGQGLFVDYLVEMRNAEKSFEEVDTWANENIEKLCHMFTVDDLGFLRRGGRLSGFTAFVGSILKIKPLLHTDNNGKLVPVKKIMGRQKALTSLVDSMVEKCEPGTKQRVFISHGDCIDEAKKVADMITQKFGIEDIFISLIGPVIGLHSGPGTVALFFMGKER